MAVNLTTQFRTQPKVISTLTSFDFSYVIGETVNLAKCIADDASVNRLQESYSMYLYGAKFTEYKTQIISYANRELRTAGISGFRMSLFDIGTPGELSTYPTLRGVRVQITTVN